MCNPKQSLAAKLNWRDTFEAIGFGEFLNVMAAARRRARRWVLDQDQKVESTSGLPSRKLRMIAGHDPIFWFKYRHQIENYWPPEE